MGMVQESKAEKAAEALQSMSAPHARVIRDGKELLIDADKVVPGDIILVGSGRSPADARLIESASLKSEDRRSPENPCPVKRMHSSNRRKALWEIGPT